MHELKPIRTAGDYEKALSEVGRLWGTASGTGEGDRLEVLATLIDAYEAEHYPMDPPDPVEAEVLNRKRSLSIGMIRRLHDRLGISAEVLIRSGQSGEAGSTR